MATDFSRRRLLAGGTAAAVATGAQAQSALGIAAPPTAATLASAQAPKRDDTVAANYHRIVITRWGDGVLPGAPAFNPDPLTGAQADTQFPYDAVIAGFITPPRAQDGVPRAVAVFANPTAPARMLFPAGTDDADVAGRLQGATVVNLEYLSGRWVTVDGGFQSRRLSDGTLCQISGPVAASIGASVQGLLAPQAGCATPWRSVLLAEGDATAWLARLANTGFGYNDPTDAPRFGWVVEFDPLDPGSFPVKRTALGRFARSGITAATAPDGRPVLFMAQDAPAGMLFRFVAAGNATDGTALDSGTLSVAQINGNTITWAELGADIPSLAGTLGAAIAAGGSAFDAPGGIAIAPDHSALYLACAGNPGRTQSDAFNPRTGDDNGHVLVFAPPDGDLTEKIFTGSLAIAAGNPADTPLTQYPAGATAWLKNPRTLNLDPRGQLWIGTDQGGKISATADGFFIMQTAGPGRYSIAAAYLAAIGAAAGGAAFDAATNTNFAMVRHPGATPQASFAAPATRWPTLQPTMPPQSTVIGLVG